MNEWYSPPPHQLLLDHIFKIKYKIIYSLAKKPYKNIHKKKGFSGCNSNFFKITGSLDFKNWSFSSGAFT